MARATHDITLWHAPQSHYSEKARWALDYKRIPHTRRKLLGGVHPPVTWLLTRGQHQTVPVVTIDGRGVGDSTAIIAELERLFPDPPLYPSDAADRNRALELEDWFDEELGEYIRRVAYHELIADPDTLLDITKSQMPGAPGPVAALARPGVKLFLDLRFHTASDEEAARAETKVNEALDRLESELDGREFLAGDSFSVADLTAASLFYPLVLPPEGPWRPPKLPPRSAERMRDLADRPGIRWVADMYARFRRPQAAARAEATA